MMDKAKSGLATLIFISILSSCKALSLSTTQTAASAPTLTPIVASTLNITFPSPLPSPASSATFPPTSTAIPNTPTSIFTLTSTLTPTLTYTASPTLQKHPPRNPEIEFPKNLNLDEWILTKHSDLEQIKRKYQDEFNSEVFPGSDVFPSPLIQGPYNKVMLNGHALIAKEEVIDSRSMIHVFHNGEEISRVDAGYSYAQPSIWALWTYQDQWVMEYITVFDDPYSRHYTLGNIVWNGDSLNNKFGYQESFGLTALNGRIFYFFRRDNQIGISYDGIEYNLGYDYITHYACCWSSIKNPHPIGGEWQWNQNLSFFAERGGNEYFVVISVK